MQFLLLKIIFRMSYQPSSIPHCSDPFLGPSLAQGCPGSQFMLFMTLLDTFIRGKREVSQLCERIIPTNPAEDYYDFIVIGGNCAIMFIIHESNYF